MAGHCDSKKEFDRIFEVDTCPDKLVAAFKTTIADDYGLKTTNAKDNIFISQMSKPSFFKTLTSNVPSKFIWAVEKINPERAQIKVRFELAKKIKNCFYMVAIILICAAYMASAVSPGSFASLSSSIIAVIRVSLATVSFISLFLLAMIIGSLLNRYNIWFKTVLSKLFDSPSGAVEKQYTEIPITEVRETIDNKIAATVVASFLCSVGFFIGGSELKSVVSHGTDIKAILLLLLVVMFVALFMIQRKRVGVYQGQKALGATNNCIISFAVLFILLGTPLATTYNVNSGLTIIKAQKTNEANSSLSVESKIMSKSGEFTDINSTKLKRSLLYVCSLFYAYSFVVWSIFVTLTISFSFGVFNILGGNASSHQQFIDYFLKNNTNAKNTNVVPTIPISTKAGLWFAFLVLSAILWLTVLINLSVLNMLVFPQWPLLTAPYGEFIVNGTKTIASIVLGNNAAGWSVILLTVILLTPGIIPFFLYVFFTLKSFLRRYKACRQRTYLKGDITEKVKEIASKMSVSKVCCVLDKNSNSLSPWAEVRGFFPKKMIVFSKAGLEFTEKFPDQGTAIIGHELAHLKYDCTRIWFFRNIARLGLVGAGFWSVLINSIKIEDRADDEACKYLRENDMDAHLLTEAAFMLETQNCLGQSYSSSQALATAFHKQQKAMPIELPTEKLSIRQKIARAFRILYEFYFETELYDYIHRDPADRLLRLENREKTAQAVS